MRYFASPQTSGAIVWVAPKKGVWSEYVFASLSSQSQYQPAAALLSGSGV